MTLINCPDCNREVSDEARRCLGCGKPIRRVGHENRSWLMPKGDGRAIFLFVCLVAWGAGFLLQDYRNQQPGGYRTHISPFVNGLWNAGAWAFIILVGRVIWLRATNRK